METGDKIINNNSIQIFEADESVHGLYGIGKFYCEYNRNELKLIIYLRFGTEKETLFDIMQGEDARTTYYRLTEMDGFVDKLSIEVILEIIKSISGKSIKELRESSRDEYLVFPRYLAMFAFNKYLKMSLSKSASVFGKHPATCSHGIEAVETESKYLKPWQREMKHKFKRKIAYFIKEKQDEKI